MTPYSAPPTPEWNEADVNLQHKYAKRNVPAGSTSASIALASSSAVNGNSQVSSLRENVQVIVRCRPKSEEEEGMDMQSCWVVKQDVGSIELAKPKLSSSSHTFKFDQVVMGVDNTQIYYPRIGALVKSTMLGYNGTVFAYGQTASGKTYTMMGNAEQSGIIPRAIEDVFTHIEEDTTGRQYLLRVSYLEIYNENIKDLLNTTNNNLNIVEDEDGIHVRNITEVKVKSAKEVFDIIRQGEVNRHISATDYNQHSSRSHAVFKLVIESRHIGFTSGVQISQLNLIDLAGSEKVTSDVERRKEGAYINKSLLTLGTVINKLTSTKGAQHIPFRNSKLTRILQGALSGNARIAVICTINPTHASKDESMNTLKFAQRAKMMETTARVTNIHDNSELKNCLIKIAELQTNLREKNETEATTRERLKNLLSLILKSSKATSAYTDSNGTGDSNFTDKIANGSGASNMTLVDDNLLNASTIQEVVGRCEETLAEQLEHMRTQHHQMQIKLQTLEDLNNQLTNTLQQRANQIDQLTDTLKKRDNHVDQLAKTLEKRENHVDKINQKLLEREQAIAQALKKVARLPKKTYTDIGVQCGEIDTVSTLSDYVPYSCSMKQQVPFILLANRFTVMLVLFYLLL